MISAWYWNNDLDYLNFGEHINWVLLDYFGVDWKPLILKDKNTHTKDCILIIGSELHKYAVSELSKCVDNIHVWGQGKGHGECFNYGQYNIIPHLVRGRLTRDELSLPDYTPTRNPGFALPAVQPIADHPNDKILYVPHHTHRQNLRPKRRHLKYDEYIDIIFHKDEFIPTLYKIVNSRFVITTSLHVSIACMAYGTPFMIYLRHDEGMNFPNKWKDVYDDLGISLKVCYNIKDGMSWWQTNVKDVTIPDPNDILETFPTVFSSSNNKENI